MPKFLIYIILLFVTLVSIYSRPYEEIDNVEQDGPNFDHGSHDEWISTFCTNNTEAQSFLTHFQQVISDLQSDESNDQILKIWAHTIVYIQNESNVVLLSSNCTEFFIGFDNVTKLDLQDAILQRQYKETVTHLFLHEKQ